MTKNVPFPTNNVMLKYKGGTSSIHFYSKVWHKFENYAKLSKSLSNVQILKHPKADGENYFEALTEMRFASKAQFRLQAINIKHQFLNRVILSKGILNQ